MLLNSNYESIILEVNAYMFFNYFFYRRNDFASHCNIILGEHVNQMDSSLLVNCVCSY